MVVSTEGTKYAWLKPGAKVKVVKARLSTFWYANKIGKEFTVKAVTRPHSDGGFDFEAEGFPYSLLEAGDVALVVQPVLNSDLREVYFSFENRQQAKALLVELETLGFRWQSGDAPTSWEGYPDVGFIGINSYGCSEQSSVERYATGVESGGAILYFVSNGRIAYGSVRHFKESNYEKRYQKVNLTFQLTVADAVLVPTETPQQAQLREIEEELKRLQQKANELRQQL